jgi:hypothetical protein
MSFVGVVPEGVSEPADLADRSQRTRRSTGTFVYGIGAATGSAPVASLLAAAASVPPGDVSIPVFNYQTLLGPISLTL